MSLLKLPKFLEEEKDAPLLILHHDDVLKKESDNIVSRVEKWRELVLNGTESKLKVSEEDSDEEPPRIIVLDAERTFVTEAHREFLIKFVQQVYKHQNGDYHQALCYVSAFLLLTCDTQTTLDIVLHLHSSKKYVPGYWKREPVAAATDAYVFHTILEKHFPKVAEHLNKQGLFPENYCQKWFSGLATQILPFEALFPFYDAFFEQGFQFLFKFGLSLIDNLQKDLLASTDFSTIFGLLRLDPKYVSFTKSDKLKVLDAEKIVSHALTFDVSDVDFATLRSELYDKHLKERMERAKQYFENEDDDDEIVFSDEEDEEDKKLTAEDEEELSEAMKNSLKLK